MKKEIRIDYLGVVLIFYLALVGIVSQATRVEVQDIVYLYNRADQMLSCLKDGIIPFFYYNDFGGVGYGSPFFYGHLTLYPFLLFVGSGINTFTNAYYLAVLALTYSGLRYFISRFTTNDRFIAVMYMVSCFGLYSIYGLGTLANCMGLAFGLFFLGSCVDFFRDKKPCYRASIFFFIVMNTHLVTGVVCFIICVILFILYFDKLRLKDYVKFTLITTGVCSYYILNVLYHSGILTRLDTINSDMIYQAENKYGWITGNYQSVFPFVGVVSTMILGYLGFDVTLLDGYKLLNIAMLLVVLYFIFKKKVSKREKIALGVVSVAYIVSISSIWVAINKVYATRIQFPTRFAMFVVLTILVIAFRGSLKRWHKLLIFCICIPDLLLFPFAISTESAEAISEAPYEQLQVVNGEYLDECFDWDFTNFDYMRSHITDQKGKEYEYIIDKDKVIVEVSGDNLTLTFPKIYYKGYKLVSSDGKDFDVGMGKSQFITSDIGDFDGTLILQYKHPVWLILLDICSLLGVVYLFVMEVRYARKKV